MFVKHHVDFVDTDKVKLKKFYERRSAQSKN